MVDLALAPSIMVKELETIPKGYPISQEVGNDDGLPTRHTLRIRVTIHALTVSAVVCQCHGRQRLGLATPNVVSIGHDVPKLAVMGRRRQIRNGSTYCYAIVNVQSCLYMTRALC